MPWPGSDDLRRALAVVAILSMTLFAGPAAGLDNTIKEGAGKVEGGFRAAGQSAAEVGGKAARAAEGAARDTGNALERAWDNIVRGLRKAFK